MSDETITTHLQETPPDALREPQSGETVMMSRDYGLIVNSRQTRSEGLTGVDMGALRRPFTPAAVQFKPLDWGITDKVAVACYIDSRLVSERLAEIDPAWTAQYVRLPNGDLTAWRQGYCVTECHLTVRGVTKIGVGQLSSGEMDDKYAKSAYSDALKRAGVEFGIGAYLYALPDFHVGRNGIKPRLKGGRVVPGKVGGLTGEGKRELRELYRTIIELPGFQARFGEAVDYGDIASNSDDLDPEAVADGADTGLTEIEKDILLMLSEHDGRRKMPPEQRRARLDTGVKDFAKELERIVIAVGRNKQLDASIRQQLQDDLVRAREDITAAEHIIEMAIGDIPL